MRNRARSQHYIRVKLPNGDRAVVDPRKLFAYCLNPQHGHGASKARVFAAIGFRLADADELRTTILAKAATEQCVYAGPTPFGHRYILDFGLERNGRKARIRTAWLIRHDEDVPRLTSCYVL